MVGRLNARFAITVGAHEELDALAIEGALCFFHSGTYASPMMRLDLGVKLAFLLAVSAPLYAKGPDCSGADKWATTMAFVHLKNAGLTNNDRLDFSKTRATLLASECIGQDLYR